MESLANKYEGERIFLVGSGPSLAETPLEAIRDEYSVAMNKINHVYETTDWRPSFYWNTKPEHKRKEQQFIQENIDSGRLCFINANHSGTFGTHDNVYYITRHELKVDPVRSSSGFHDMGLSDVEDASTDDLLPFWSADPSERVFTYHSMYGVLQLVTYLGFDELYLVGCDLGYGVYDPHMIFDSGLDPLDYSQDEQGKYLRESLNQRVFVRSLINGIVYKLYYTPLIDLYSKLMGTLPGEGDPNHFTDNYREKPKDNTYANDEIRKSHIVAKTILDERSVDVYNATVGGELEVYPRVDIEDIV